MRRTRVLVLVVATVGLGGLAVQSVLAGTNPCCKGGPLYGVLNGQNEIGADGKKKAGDPDGKGSASAIYDEGKLCFGLTVKNIGTPTAAHIHKATRGQNGPVVVPLTAPSAGDPGASSGCVDVTETLARAILKNPHKYYWNVHTSDFPGGAIRGQVFVRTK